MFIALKNCYIRIALYERLGFVRKEMPEHVIEMGEDPNVFAYMELRKQTNPDL